MTIPPRDVWKASFEDAEANALNAGIDTGPGGRLAWLEDAVRFAVSVGALPRPAELADDNSNAPQSPAPSAGGRALSPKSRRD
jgi:hypothetical protein